MLIVKKFGGTSLANPERIKHIIRIVKKFAQKGEKIVLVVSAPSGMTDKILDDLKSFDDGQQQNPLINQNQIEREKDQAVICGESLNAAMVAYGLNHAGLKAKSFNALNLPIFGSEKFGDSEILEINKQKILEHLENGFIPVITGFQALSFNKEDCMSLGRGGSDYTAVMLSAALNADECYIYTDVEGIFETDPNLVKHARKINNLSFDEAVQICQAGAKVLQDKSAVAARKYNVNLRILSSFLDEDQLGESSGTSVLSGSFLKREREEFYSVISYKILERLMPENLYEISIFFIGDDGNFASIKANFHEKLADFLESEKELIASEDLKFQFKILETKENFEKLLNKLYDFCKMN